MRKPRSRKFVLAVLTLVGLLAAASALAANPSTFNSNTAGNSGAAGATNGQCFVLYKWDEPLGFTHIKVTSNGNQRWSRTGMAYTGAAQVRCTNNLLYARGFDTNSQEVYSPSCPFGYFPNNWAGTMWSWTTNGCVL